MSHRVSEKWHLNVSTTTPKGSICSSKRSSNGKHEKMIVQGFEEERLIMKELKKWKYYVKTNV